MGLDRLDKLVDTITLPENFSERGDLAVVLKDVHTRTQVVMAALDYDIHDVMKDHESLGVHIERIYNFIQKYIPLFSIDNPDHIAQVVVFLKGEAAHVEAEYRLSQELHDFYRTYFNLLARLRNVKDTINSNPLLDGSGGLYPNEYETELWESLRNFIECMADSQVDESQWREVPFEFEE